MLVPCSGGVEGGGLYTENGIAIDLAEVKKAVEQADVLAVGFRLFPERLLVDTRCDAKAPPLVQVVEPVASVEQRFFWLGQHRPSLGTPERFVFFLWPHSIPFLRDSSLGTAITERIVATGCDGAVPMCEAAFADLAQRERKANLAAVRGQSCFTLWPRRA